MAKTIELVQNYLNNAEVAISEEVTITLPSTGQTLGQIMIGEDAVKSHLETLAADYGNEWHGVDSADLYTDTRSLNDGLRYVGENDSELPVWIQLY